MTEISKEQLRIEALWRTAAEMEDAIRRRVDKPGFPMPNKVVNVVPGVGPVETDDNCIVMFCVKLILSEIALRRATAEQREQETRNKIEKGRRGGRGDGTGNGDIVTWEQG